MAMGGLISYAVGDDGYVLAVEFKTGKDGAITAVDGIYCSTQVCMGQKKSTCRHQHKLVKVTSW